MISLGIIEFCPMPMPLRSAIVLSCWGLLIRTKNAARKLHNVGGVRYEKFIDDFLATDTIDVVCVAAPEKTHYQILTRLSEAPIKFVFTEKPFCSELKQAQDITYLYQKKDIPILVNFTRRFVKAYQQLRSEIKLGFTGRFLGGAGFYGKGLNHNGSHLIDLLGYLFGFSHLEAKGHIESIYDGPEEDPSVNGFLRVKGQIFTLNAIHRDSVNVFEMVLYFENIKICLTDNGQDITGYKTQKRPDYPSDRIYASSDDAIKTIADFNQAMPNAVNNIREHLIYDEGLISPATEAVKTMALCQKTKEQHYVPFSRK